MITVSEASIHGYLAQVYDLMLRRQSFTMKNSQWSITELFMESRKQRELGREVWEYIYIPEPKPKTTQLQQQKPLPDLLASNTPYFLIIH